MCCLKYEQYAYEDLLRNAPKAESFVDTPEGRGTVTEVDLLRQRVKVRMEDRPEDILVFGNDEIAVLRSGKAKKTDAPIPADLAPISGSGKRIRKEEPERPVFLESVKFRYSEDTVAEEVGIPEEEPAEEEAAAPVRKNNRRRNKQKGNREGKPQQPKPQAEPKPQEPKAAAEDKPKKPNNHHRRNYHHRHRKPGTNGNAAE